MPRLPDVDSLGPRPTPRYQSSVASVRNAGAVGEAVAQIGDRINQLGVQKQEKEDRLAYAAANTELLKADVDLREQIRSNPDFNSWRQTYETGMKAARERAAKLIQSRSDRQAFITASDQSILRGASTMAEGAFERRASTETAVALQHMADLQELAKRAPDEATRIEIVNTIPTIIKGLIDKNYITPIQAFEKQRQWGDAYKAGQADAGGATAAIKYQGAVQAFANPEESERLIKEGGAEVARVGRAIGKSRDEITLDMLNRTSATRHDVVGAKVNAGDFAGASAYLEQHKADFTGDDLLSAQSDIRTELRSQQNEAKAAFTEAAATVEAQAANGRDVSAELPALIQKAEALGDTSKAEHLRGLLGDQTFAKVYETKTPLIREQRLAELAGKKNPSTAEQQELKWLREHSGALDSAFNSDPAGFLAEHGNAPPAIGPERAAWRRTMTEATGRYVPPLTKEEAQTLADRRLQPNGDAEVLAALDTMPEGEERAYAARQVAAHDVVFQHVAQLNPGARPVVIAGAEAIKANPKIFDAPNDPRVKTMMAEMDRDLRIALKEFSPEDQQATIEVARQFMAGVMSKSGLTAENLKAERYQAGMRVALGGGRENGAIRGGLGNWGGHPFVLPSGSTNASFGRAVSGYFAEHIPTNPDGSRIAIASIIPVMIGQNVYRFEGADGRVVADQDRKPLVLTIRRKQ